MKRRECLWAGLGAALGTVPVSGRAEEGGAVVDWPAIRLLDGAILEPSAWRAQAAVLVFWSITCPFCKRHNAHVDKLHRSMLGKPLRVLGLAVDGDAQAVHDYMRTNDYHFPVALDAGVLRPRLTSRRVIPMTCTIDRNGRLLQAIPGEMFEDDVLALGKLARV